MTSRLAAIASQSRAVVSNTSIGMVDGWEFRRLTSSPGTEPRTFGEWAEFFVLPTSGQHNEQFDSDRNTFKQLSTQRIRCADDATGRELRQGDQVKDPAGSVWAVSGVATSGPGSIAYSIVREVGFFADGDRKGGL